MKEVNLPSGDYTFIEVLDDAKQFDDAYKQLLEFKDENNNIGISYNNRALVMQMISTTNDITEEQCESIVGFINNPENNGDIPYKNYNHNFLGVETAKESLQSLIQSVGLDIKLNYLILKKI